MRWRGWVRAEILILRQCAGTMKVKSIGSLIGRSEAAVRTKAREMGISLICVVIFTSQQNIRRVILSWRDNLHQRGVSGEKSPENSECRCAQ